MDLKLGKYQISFLKLNWLAYLVLIAVYIYTVFFTLIHNLNSEGYILGDWLINYEDGGFKRRGLSGSFFFLLQDLTGFRLNYLVYFFQFLIITFFFFTFYKLIKTKEVTISYLSLMLSSVGFVGLLNSVDYVGKKEFILFAIFVYFAYLLSKNNLTKKKEWLVCALLFVSVLWHEIVLFFVPYFIILKYFKTGNRNYWSYLKYFLAVLIPALAIIFFGKEINEGNSLAILKERGVVFTKGIFFWDEVDEKAVLLHRLKHFFIYFIGFLLSFLHVGFYLNTTQKSLKNIGFFLIAAFLYSLPLFYLGLDWGRWLYVHMMMVAIFMGVFIKRDYVFDFTRKYLWFFLLVIFFSLIYRVELSGKFTFEGLFYRIFIAQTELLEKML